MSGSAATGDNAFRVSTIGAGTYIIGEVNAAVPRVDGVPPDEPDRSNPPLSSSPDVAWGVISKWSCLDLDCWNEDGTENTFADWNWIARLRGFGSGGTFLAPPALEASRLSDADKWRFTFGKSTYAEEPDAGLARHFGRRRRGHST